MHYVYLMSLGLDAVIILIHFHSFVLEISRLFNDLPFSTVGKCENNNNDVEKTDFDVENEDSESNVSCE